jgi:transcriptional regulator with XRE-family HTH domain
VVGERTSSRLSTSQVALKEATMPEEAKLTLGQYIRQERINYMSLRSFAKELGVSASYLSDVERDKRTTSKKMLERIAVCFGRVIGGSHHRRYDMMLILSGQMTPERRELKILWSALRVLTYDPIFKDWAAGAYDALYGELDIALYGFPINKVDLIGGDK